MTLPLRVKSSAVLSGSCTLSPITTSAPIFRATSTGKLLLIPPSTNTISPFRIGVKAPGIAILARIASISEPLWYTYSASPIISVETQAKGIGNLLKSIESRYR